MIKKVAERSYLVRTPQGHLLRRNRKFLRATGEISEETANPTRLPTEPEGTINPTRLPTEPFRPEQSPGKSESIQDSHGQSAQANRETSEHQEEPTAAEQQQLDNNSSDIAGSPMKTTRAGRTMKTPDLYKDFIRL